MAGVLSSALYFVSNVLHLTSSSAPPPSYHAGCGGSGCNHLLSAHLDRTLGFTRAEMGSKSAAGTVGAYQRHVFCGGGRAKEWSAKGLESSAAAVRVSELLEDKKLAAKLTLFEDEAASPRVLLFPAMVAVEAAAVESSPGLALDPQGHGTPLSGLYFFVCSHASRDARCGACGPVLTCALRRAAACMHIEAHVYMCSHVGGHDMAGNVLVFYRHPDGSVAGDWYGYVTPDACVDILKAAHAGHVFEPLWRGSMSPATTTTTTATATAAATTTTAAAAAATTSSGLVSHERSEEGSQRVAAEKM